MSLQHDLETVKKELDKYIKRLEEIYMSGGKLIPSSNFTGDDERVFDDENQPLIIRKIAASKNLLNAINVIYENEINKSLSKHSPSIQTESLPSIEEARKVLENHSKESAILRQRRGNSSIWKLINKIRKQFGKEETTFGVKGAKVVNHISSIFPNNENKTVVKNESLVKHDSRPKKR